MLCVPVVCGVDSVGWALVTDDDEPVIALAGSAPEYGLKSMLFGAGDVLAYVSSVGPFAS